MDIIKVGWNYFELGLKTNYRVDSMIMIIRNFFWNPSLESKPTIFIGFRGFYHFKADK